MTGHVYRRNATKTKEGWTEDASRLTMTGRSRRQSRGAWPIFREGNMSQISYVFAKMSSKLATQNHRLIVANRLIVKHC